MSSADVYRMGRALFEYEDHSFCHFECDFLSIVAKGKALYGVKGPIPKWFLILGISPEVESYQLSIAPINFNAKPTRLMIPVETRCICATGCYSVWRNLDHCLLEMSIRKFALQKLHRLVLRHSNAKR